MIILLLISIQIFPNNSTDFTAYGLSFGGGIMGERFTNLITDDPWWRFLGGVAGTIGFTLIFDKHIETDEERTWNAIGRGHFIIFNISYLTLEHFLKKKKRTQ